MYSRLLNPVGKSSFFLFGPRGIGKSTWLKSHYPKNTYIDLLDSSVYTQLLAEPERLADFLQKQPIIIDEVQRIPALLNEAHRWIANKKIQFILTGSSARKLKRGGTNLLAGRALMKAMFPLTTIELADDFNLSKALRLGCLPAVQNHEDPKAYLSAYVETYLREEIMQEALVRNLAAFTRFLRAASFSQAALLSVAQVARECQVERKVVENYFSILDDLMIGVRLPVFSKKAKRELTTHPKFFYFDVGVWRAIRPTGPLDGPDEQDGAALETLLFQEARALNHYSNWEYEFFHWRTKNQKEVDLVLYGPRGLWAFEIKRSRRWDKADLRGLAEFKKDYPKARVVLLYGGEHKAGFEGIEVWPYEATLKNLRGILG